MTRQHNAKAGFYGFLQRDSVLFVVRGTADEGTFISLAQRQKLNGNLAAVFIEDQYQPTNWLTLTGGARFTRFRGALNESATSPRVGAAIRIPRLNWVLHGFYGRYYQVPPLSTVSGPLLDVAMELYDGPDAQRGFVSTADAFNKDIEPPTLVFEGK